MARRRPSTAKKRTVSSIPTGPATRRSRRKPATVASGSSCSFQTRISAGTFRLSRTEGSSKCGVTIARLALAREDRGGQPLAAPPLHAGEIGHRRAGLDQQRAEPVPRPSAAAPWRCGRDIRRGRSGRRRRSSAAARPPPPGRTGGSARREPAAAAPIARKLACCGIAPPALADEPGLAVGRARSARCPARQARRTAATIGEP